MHRLRAPRQLARVLEPTREQYSLSCYRLIRGNQRHGPQQRAQLDWQPAGHATRHADGRRDGHCRRKRESVVEGKFGGAVEADNLNAASAAWT